MAANAHGPDRAVVRVQHDDGQELSILTVRVSKELRVLLWQMKIIRGVKIETFIQDAIEEKLGRVGQ